MPLPQMRDQPLFHVVAHLPQHLIATAVVEVSHPSTDGGVHLLHYPVKRHYRPFSSCERGDPIFDRLQGFLRRLDMRVEVSRFPAFAHPNCEFEEVELPFPGVVSIRAIPLPPLFGCVNKAGSLPSDRVMLSQSSNGTMDPSDSRCSSPRLRFLIRAG